MAKQVDCPCGATMRGDTDDELVTNVEQHVRENHPDMVDTMTRDKIMEMAHDA
jgi:predicted small metal-binding protein